MRRPLLLFLLALTFGVLGSGANAQQAAPARSDCPRAEARSLPGPRRLALVIAISDYDGDGSVRPYPLGSPDEGLMSDLPNPINDGNRMRDTLCRLGFEVTMVQNPNKAGLELALADFGAQLAAAQEPVALIYYSGHAIQVNGENWLVPSGARLPLDRDLTRLPEQVQAGYIAAQALPMRTIFQYFRNPELSGQGVNLVFIDACRNNPWEERIFGRARGGATRGLADQPPPSRIGTLVAYSTSAGDVADDGASGGNSPFTVALLELIEQPGVSIMDLLIEVRRRVYARTSQAPSETGSLVARFCFAGCDRPPPADLARVGIVAAPSPPVAVAAGPAQSAGATLRSISAEDWSAKWPSVHRGALDRLGFATVRRLAEAGDARAQFLTAHAFEAGVGVQQDDRQALTWLQRAAERGEPRALGELGVRRLLGRGVPVDQAGAATLLRRAAERGDANAEMNLGRIYSEGLGVPRDDAMAATWFLRAAARGYAPGQALAGLVLSGGLGVAQDVSQSVGWFQRAAEQGEREAQFYLGTAYAEGRGIARDDAQAAIWFRRSAEQGHANAQYNLGASYAGGRGVPQSYAEAFIWFLRAANQGVAQAQNNVGILYDTGNGAVRDYEQARLWYRRASEQGNSFAQYSLGLSLYDGRPGFPPNQADGLALIRRAAAGGSEPARAWLAERRLPLQ